jgi:hypothetical protein
MMNAKNAMNAKQWHLSLLKKGPAPMWELFFFSSLRPQRPQREILFLRLCHNDGLDVGQGLHAAVDGGDLHRPGLTIG